MSKKNIMETTMRKRIKRMFRPFLAGTIALLPLSLTVIALVWLVSLLLKIMGPGSMFGQIVKSVGLNITGNYTIAYLIGISIIFVFIYVFGLFILTRLNKHWHKFIDALMNRIPFVKKLYEASNKLVKIFGKKNESDMKNMSPVLISFGEKGETSMLALLTSNEPVFVNQVACYSVMIPTAPIPMGGAIFYIPKNWVQKVDMNLDGFINVYMSMGLASSEYLQTKV